MARTVEHLRRRRRLFRQARPSRQGRRVPPLRPGRGGRRLEARAGQRGGLHGLRASQAIRRPCSPAPTTACGAAPIAAPPSGAPTSRTPRSRSGASWSTAAIPSACSPAPRRSTSIAATTAATSWRKLATPKIAEPLQGSVRVARHALRPAPEEAGRDLRRARDQRRDAQHRRRRDLAGLQRGADQARRAAASQEQARERHHGRGHARRPCRHHQSGRSRHRHRGAAHGPVPHRPTAARPGRTWRSAASRRPPTAATSRSRPASPTRSMPRSRSPPRATTAGSIAAQDGGQSWKRFDKVQVHGTIMSIGLHQSDPNQVYIGARYDGEVFGTQDGGKSWQAMPLPGEVQHIYSVACG